MKGKNKIGLVLCSLVTLICLGSFTQATTYKGSCACCYVTASFPDSSPSNSAYSSVFMISGTSGDECITFIQIYLTFHGIPAAKDYNKAELVLTLSNGTVLPAEVVIDVLNCTHIIDVDNLTWNTVPTPLGPKLEEITLTSEEFIGGDNVVKYFDITSYLGKEYTRMTFVFMTSADVLIYIGDSYIRYTVTTPIPSYNIFIILGIVSVLPVILCKKIQINRK